MIDFIAELEKIDGIEKVEHVTDLRKPSHDILVINFRPEDSQPLISFGLSLEGYNPNGSLAAKIWCNNELRADGPGPSLHPDYHQFEHKGAQFKPYSIQTGTYVFSATSIADLLSEIYEYTK